MKFPVSPLSGIATTATPSASARPHSQRSNPADSSTSTDDASADESPVVSTCVNFEDADHLCRAMDTARISLDGIRIVPLSRAAVHSAARPIHKCSTPSSSPEMVAFALEFHNSHTAIIPGESRLADKFPDAVLNVAGVTPTKAPVPPVTGQQQAGKQPPLQRTSTPPVENRAKGKADGEGESEFGTKEMQDFVHQRQLQLERQLQALGGGGSRSSRNKAIKPAGAAGTESRPQQGPSSGDDMSAYIFG